MEKLINSLKKLGLTRYEAQAYIGLNKIITGQADEIAEASNIPRSRIYDILNELEKKGFVEIERGRPLKYKVIPPNTIINDEKEKIVMELENAENKLKEIYNKEFSEIQAPVWLIHSPENIIKRETKNLNYLIVDDEITFFLPLSDDENISDEDIAKISDLIKGEYVKTESVNQEYRIKFKYGL